MTGTQQNTTREPTILFFGNPWCSSEIRGRQVAERANWLYDSDSMRTGDKVVFIKSYPEPDFVDTCRANNIELYIDVVDCYGIIPFLDEVPEAKVIAMSKVGLDYLKGKVKNEIRYVPEHHCNFDNELRNVSEIKTVGFIGYDCNFQLDPDVVTKYLNKLGLKFIMKTEFETREDVLEFYRKIDVQLAFRVPGSVHMLVSQLKNPLKLCNAGSFGIPTIAFPELSYVDEWSGYFFPIGSMDGVIYWLTKMLDDFEVYKSMSEAAMHRARYYHIDNIIKKYKEAFYGKPDIKYGGGQHSISLTRKTYPEYLKEQEAKSASARADSCVP